MDGQQSNDRLDRALSDLATSEVPSWLEASVIDRVRAEQVVSRAGRGGFRQAFASMAVVAAGMAIVLVALPVLRPPTSPGPSGTPGSAVGGLRTYVPTPSPEPSSSTPTLTPTPQPANTATATPADPTASPIPIRPSGPPPPVTVRTADKAFDLEAWTYCYGNSCVDGAPPMDPPDVGDASSVEVEFPLGGWTFDASFTQIGPDCPRRQTVTLAQTGEHTYLLEPAGRAGTYDVTLFGRGNGDLFVSFRWTTPHDGTMPVPIASIAILADHDGVVDSYGVEMYVSGLAVTPHSARAQVRVTASNGRSVTFEPVSDVGCMGEGELYWNEPDSAGLEAAALGQGPFTYDVVLSLDGVRYTATAVWPDDVIEGSEPSVSLEFTPPLPALR